MTAKRRGARRWTTALALALVAGCALGFRGEAPIVGEHDLTGTTELRIELPDTPMLIDACAAGDPEICPERVRYEGTWHAVAGSPGDARDRASIPVLRFERDGGFGALRAEVPLEVQGIVDLEMDLIELPDDRHLDIRTGTGDVTVLGSQASVSIDVEAGDIEVRGARGGLAVRTGIGDITATTGGHAELRTRSGHVVIEQDENARDLYVETGDGEIAVTLASDADIDLEIRTKGRISVQTNNIAAVTSDSLSRENGNGSIRVELVSPRGDVSVVQR